MGESTDDRSAIFQEINELYLLVHPQRIGDLQMGGYPTRKVIFQRCIHSLIVAGTKASVKAGGGRVYAGRRTRAARLYKRMRHTEHILPAESIGDVLHNYVFCHQYFEICKLAVDYFMRVTVVCLIRNPNQAAYIIVLFNMYSLGVAGQCHC